ncbi:hypothetical protein BIW11_12933 [Tropilaelaps mercedesae]|uniref:Uncharacterized protein n=1 Tax=Tropilaelaps mercedesae TaxID=418985 RepID=A0A1V9X4I1_9ACAR|nr:hypothetical protein BIW11_12933 [Tropilaelaps mercedesae]
MPLGRIYETTGQCANMNRARFEFLHLAHAQMEVLHHGNQFREEIYQHTKAVEALKNGILDGEIERRNLEESLSRLRLSKVIEALRRLNQHEDFNGALQDLVQNLTAFSDVLALIDGTSIRNAQPFETQEFLEQLEELASNWRAFDDTCPEILTLNQELQSMRDKLQKCEHMLRQTAVNLMLVDV